jgi:hypothetical protein
MPVEPDGLTHRARSRDCLRERADGRLPDELGQGVEDENRVLDPREMPGSRYYVELHLRGLQFSNRCA